jgi:sugar (pentulose or hexulose) kinase
VYRIEVSKSAALGAALIAAQANFTAAGKKIAWTDVVAGFTDTIPGSEVKPDKPAGKVYDKLFVKYAKCEAGVLKKLAAK